MTAPVEAQAGAPEASQDWIFTFGPGHTYRGESLGGRFVRIPGTYMQARVSMIAVFGREWCDQYASEADAGVAQYRLKELQVSDRERADALARYLAAELTGEAA